MKIDYLPYGAEWLNKAKLKHTAIAQSLALLLVVFCFSYPLIKEMLKGDQEKEQLYVKARKVVNYSELSAPPPIDLEREQPKILKSPPKVKTVQFLQPVAKKDEEVIDEEIVPSMDEMEQTQIADFEQDGIDSITVGPEETIEIIPEEEEKVYGYVEKMPEFPNGGEAAFFKYLSEELRYPPMAKDAGLEGIVIVGFVIEMDGSISNIQLMRSVHSTLDQEALRVIQEMPKWAPGIQNGREVRVSFTVPIKFNLLNE